MIVLMISSSSFGLSFVGLGSTETAWASVGSCKPSVFLSQSSASMALMEFTSDSSNNFSGFWASIVGLAGISAFSSEFSLRIVVVVDEVSSPSSL